MSKVLEAIAKYPFLHTVIVYGSRASGGAGFDSDWDIAVAGPKPLPVDDILEMSQHLASELKSEIDLVDLRAVRGALLQEILVRGNCLQKDLPFFEETLRRMLREQDDDARLITNIVLARMKGRKHES